MMLNRSRSLLLGAAAICVLVGGRLLALDGGASEAPAKVTAGSAAADRAARPSADDDYRVEPPSATVDADSPPAAPLAPAVARPALTPELVQLRDKVSKALTAYYPRHLSASQNNPWEVMHGIIAYGVNAQLFRGAPGSEKVNAVSWMCYNGACQGDHMLMLDGNKRLLARKGPGLQGHFGQFLAILAQSHVKIDYPMNVSGKAFTIRDLVELEKQDCEAGTELTFKLIALMHYLDSDETWTSRDGQKWSIQRLVREELQQPIRNAACGGTHRLMGFSYAVNKRIQRGKSITGEFRRAQIFLADYHRYTFTLQNADGSFSTEWFNRRGSNPDVDRRLKTSGHVLEWLSFSLSDEELRNPRMVKAVNYLSGILLADESRTWEVGPLCHSLHALRIYQRRVFKSAEGVPALAEQPQAETAQQGTLPLKQ